MGALYTQQRPLEPLRRSTGALPPERERDEQSEDGLLVKVRQAWELVKRNKLNMEEEAFRGTLNRQGLQDLSNLAADALALCWWRVLIVVLRTLALTACDDDFVARTVSATGILHTASVAIVEAGVVGFFLPFILI